MAADLTDEAARAAIPTTLAERGLTIDVLVNNAGLSTTGAVAKSDVAAELRMIRTDVEAVVHLCSARRAGHGRARARRGAQRRVDGRLPAAPGPGRLRRVQGVRAVLHAGARRRSCTARASPPRTLCPGPVETEFAEAAGFGDEVAGDSLPKIMWVSAADVAKAAIDGMAKGKPVVIPGTGQPRGRERSPISSPRRLLLPILARQHPALK